MLAGSTLFEYSIELNGKKIYRQNDLPGRHQMPLPSYLVFATSAMSRKGRNTLRIIIANRQKNWRKFQLAIDGVVDEIIWNIPHKTIAIELPDRIGAKQIFDSNNININNDPFSITVSRCDTRRFAVLDFGQVITGRLTLQIKANSSGQIYLAYGFNCSKGSVDCNRMHLRAVDILKVPQGKSTYNAFDLRTFRYLELVFEGFDDDEVTISDINLAEDIFLDDRQSSFDSSDITANKIFSASKRTAQLCCTEVFVDNPEREHTQWIDCTLAVTSAGNYLFGDYRRTEKVLREFALSQQEDGQLPGYAPGRWFPRIPLQGHMAFFAIGTHRYFMHTGNERFAEDMLKIIMKMIDHWERHRTKNNLITDLHTVFVDWGSHIYSYGRGSKGPTGALTTLNSYYLGVLKLTADLAEFLGKEKTASQLRAIYEQVRNAIWKQMFDPQLGLFRDGVGNPEAERNISQPANILAVLYGAAPRGKRAEILARAFTDDTLGIIPANAHFVRQAGEALFEAGLGELALEWIRDGFGKMIDTGPGTLWETWEPYASLCQATGAGIGYLFSRYLAGLYPIEPGYRKIAIFPQPSGLKYVNANLLTPYGHITIRWQSKGEKIIYHLSLPKALQNNPIVKADYVDLIMLKETSNEIWNS